MLEKLSPYKIPILLLLGILLAGKLIQFFLLIPLVEAAYAGESFSYLNKLLTHHQLKDPDVRDLAFYRSEVPKYINRLIVLGGICTTLLWVIFRNSQQRFNAFLYEEKTALSLAILRISVLGLILYMNFPAALTQVVDLGTNSIVPPMGWPVDVIELLSNPLFTKAIGYSFLIFSVGAFLGFYTNYMLIGATITGFFAMGIPQFYGKMDSYHILWHILIVLSFSKCGYSLSVDAWRKKHPQINLMRSSAFGLPIKIVMIFMGVLYFFPGFWKFIFSGLEWAFSDNLKLKLYSKWMQLDGWTPFFRVDRYPFLYQPAAFITLIIEIGFVFALFFKKVRPLFVVGALGFHLSVLYLMKVPFYSMMVLYVVFIDWETIVGKLSEQFRGFKTDPLTSSVFKQSNKWLLWIGGFLIAGNILSGALLIKSWPFTVYPTFASMESGTVPSILIQAVNENDEVIEEKIPILEKEFKDEFDSSVKLRGFLTEILNAEQPNNSQMIKLKEIFLESSPTSIRTSSNVQLNFYEIRLSTNPDEQPKNYSIEKLIYQLKERDPS